MPTNVSNVDQRIVEMRIDNDKFEAGAKKTLDLLDKLDASLNGLGKTNTEGFDNVSKSLEVMTDKFSVMGTVGDQVIRNLTNKAMELVGQFRNMATVLTSQQISAGFEKYAEKTTAVQTIMAATNNLVGEGLQWKDQEEQIKGVTEQLERLTWFADETSYSFTDMVNNVGKFTAAGRKLGESVTAMQGISTWAAISGGKPAEAARAMYNLSQALGMGAVTAIDWKSIELANMATYEFKQNAIDTAVELGRLRKVSDGTWETVQGGFEVTVEKFRDSLTFGKGDDKVQWFDADVLLSVLNRYGEFSQLVKNVQTNLEYGSATEVLSDLKKYEKLVNNGADATSFLERRSAELGTTADNLKDSFITLLRPEYDLGRRAFQAAQEAKTFAEAIDATKDAVSTKWMDIYELIFGNYLQAKELWTSLAETMWNVFAGPIDNLLEFFEEGFGETSRKFAQFFNADVTGVSGSIQQAAKSTESFEEKLNKAGKTMADFEKALKSVADRSLLDNIENFNSIEDALKAGIISNDVFKRALSMLDDGTSKTMSLQMALAKNKKTMKDFEKAVYSVADRAAIEAIENFNGVEDALKKGAISADLFKKALSELGIDAENVTADAEKQVKASIGSLGDLRETAMAILRGDYGNGEERIQNLFSAGYSEEDIELLQAMAGNLKNLGTEISDEYLTELMEAYWQFNQLGEVYGIETFSEWLGTTNEELYTMDNLLNESEEVLRSVYGNSIFNENGELMTGGELFREGLQNIIEFLGSLADMTNKIFTKIFGGGKSAEEAAENLGFRLYGLANAFHAFSESLLMEDENGDPTELYHKLEAIMTGIAKAVKIVGTVLGTIFKIMFKIVGLAFRLAGIVVDILLNSGIYDVIETVLTGILAVVTAISDIVSGGFTGLTDSIGYMLEDSPLLLSIFGGIAEALITIAEIIGSGLILAFDKLSHFMGIIVNYFNIGYERGGLVEGLKNVIAWFRVLLKDRPILLGFFNAIIAVVNFLGEALSHLGDILMFIAGFIAMTFGGIFSVLSRVFGVIKEGLTTVYNWIKSNKTLNKIITSLEIKLKRFWLIIRVISEHMQKGYEKNGFQGAMEEFKRTFNTFFPIGRKISDLFDRITTAFKNFKIGTKETAEDTEKRANIFARIFTAIFGDPNNAKTNIKTFFQGWWETILGFIRSVRVSDIIKAFRLSLVASLLLKVYNAITIFKDIGKSIKSIPDAIKDTIGRIGEYISSMAQSIRADVVLKFATAIGILAGAFLVMSYIPQDKLAYVAGISAIMIYLITQMAKVFNAAGLLAGDLKVINVQLIPRLAATLFSIGFALLSFALSIKILATLDNSKGDVTRALWSIVGLVAVIVAVMALFAVILRKTSPVKIGNIGFTIGKIALAMFGLSLAIQALMIPVAAFVGLQFLGKNGSGVAKFRTAIIAVIGLIAIIGIFFFRVIKATESLLPWQIMAVGPLLKKMASAMIGVAFAVQLLVVAIAALAVLQNNGIGKYWAAVAVAVDLIIVLGGMFIVLIREFGKIMQNQTLIDGTGTDITELGKTLLKMSAAMILVGVAVGIIVGTIAKLAAVISKDKDSAGIAIASVSLILIALVGMFALLAHSFSKDMGGRRIKEIGTAILKIAGAMVLIGIAIKAIMRPIIELTKLEALDFKKLLSVTALVGGLMVVLVLAFIGITALINKFGGKGDDGAKRISAIGKALIGLGAAFALFAVGVALITPLLIGLGGAIAALGEYLPEMKNFWKMFGRLMAMGAGFIVLGVGLSALGIGLTAIAVAFTIFSAGLILFAIAAGVFTVHSDDINKALPAFIQSMVDAGKLILDHWKEIAAISALILVLGFLTKQINKTGIITNGITAIFKGITSKTTAFFTNFIDILTNKKKEILSVITALITLIGFYISGAMPALAETIVQAVISLNNSIATSLENNKEAFADSFVSVFKAVVGVLASVIHKLFSEQLWGELDGVEKAITIAFGVGAIIKFIVWIARAISAIDAAKKALVGSQGLLTAAEEGLASGSIINGLISICGWLVTIAVIAGSVAAIIKGMKDLRDGTGWWESAKKSEVKRNMELYGEEHPSVDTRLDQLDEIQEKEEELIKTQEELTSALNEELDNNGFTKNAEDLLDAQLKAAEKANDYAIKRQFALAETAALIAGELDGPYYRMVLKQLKEFGNVDALIDSEGYKQQTTALQTRIDQVESLMKALNDPTITDYSSHMEAISYLANLAGISTDKALENAKKFANITGTDQTYLQSLYGEYYMAQEAYEDALRFESNINANRLEYEQKMKQTVEGEVEAIEDANSANANTKPPVDIEETQAATEAVSELEEATATIKEETEETTEVLAEAANEQQTIIDQLKSFGMTDEQISRIPLDKLADFKEQLTSLNLGQSFSGLWDSIKGLLPGSELYSSGEESGNFLFDGLIDTFLDSGNLSELGSAAQGLYTNGISEPFDFISDIASPSGEMMKKGKYLDQGLALGVELYSGSPYLAMINLFKRIKEPFAMAKEEFYNSGIDIVQGLVNGIEENIYQAYESGTSLAEALENGFTTYLGIESPSKVFYSLAGYITEGAKLGIKDGQDGVIDSVVVLSDELVMAMYAAMARVSAIADEDFQWSPTITPVVDTTNLDAAASYAGRAFSGNYSMSSQLANGMSQNLKNIERMASDAAAAAGNGFGGETVNINMSVYGAEGQDINALADIVVGRISTGLSRRGSAFGH